MAAVANYKRVHQDLQELIRTLGSKLSDVTNHYEHEFLAAYRIHQISIHEELKELRDRVAKAEETLIEDSAVARMEEECSWFRGESNRLQSHVSAMMKDMNSMNLRLGELREQRAYLSDQLKAIMKRSRVYGAEIDYMKNSVSTTLKDKSITSSQSQIMLPSTSNSISSNSLKNSKKSSKRGGIKNSASEPHLKHPEYAVNHFKHLREKFDGQLKTLEDGKTGWDSILEDALASQFHKVVERKTHGVLRTLRKKSDIAEYGGEKATPGVVPPAFAHEIPKINGLTGLGVEHFTDIDKFQTLVSVLSHPAIFREVVQELSGNL